MTQPQNKNWAWTFPVGYTAAPEQKHHTIELEAGQTRGMTDNDKSKGDAAKVFEGRLAAASKTGWTPMQGWLAQSKKDEPFVSFFIDGNGSDDKNGASRKI